MMAAVAAGGTVAEVCYMQAGAQRVGLRKSMKSGHSSTLVQSLQAANPELPMEQLM
jgi:hypothetical protein